MWASYKTGIMLNQDDIQPIILLKNTQCWNQQIRVAISEIGENDLPIMRPFI
jgi:hypothetical protein